MPLFSAMNSAISSLMANSQSLAMIGDNVANNKTHGYKGTNALFRSLLSDRNSAISYTANGVQGYASRYVDMTCAPQASECATHMMVDGKGFFITSRNNTPQRTDLIYTKAGDFEFDMNGYLTNGNHHYAMGWRLNAQGVPVKKDGVTPVNQSSLGDLSPIQIGGINGFSKATSQITLGANLPSNLAGTGADTAQNTVLRVYDSLGAEHDLTFEWQKTNNAPLTWTVSVSGGAGDVIRKNNVSGDLIGRPATTGTSPITIVFDDHGLPVSFDGANTPPPLFIQWANTSASAQTVALNLGTVGQPDGLTSKAGHFQNRPAQQDGERLSNLTGLAVNEKGIVRAIFDNGQSVDLWKIPLATFANANQLAPTAGTGYLPTAQSGDPTLVTAQESIASAFIPQALESSSVDLATEFTKMIITQRSYSAASKVIVTADEMLDALERIRR